MQLPALQDKSADAAKQIISAVQTGHDCAEVLVKGGGKWEKALLLCNASTEAREFALPEGMWQLLCDDRSSFLWNTPSAYTDLIKLPARSAFILGKIC